MLFTSFALFQNKSISWHFSDDLLTFNTNFSTFNSPKVLFYKMASSNGSWSFGIGKQSKTTKNKRVESQRFQKRKENALIERKSRRGDCQKIVKKKFQNITFWSKEYTKV